MVSEVVADLIEDIGFEHEAVLAGLEAAGYMEKVRGDNEGDVWWDTTIQGNALAMASFGKPITRKTADRLVSGLLERAHTYNADPDKPLFINTLRVFGSYLSPEIDPIGDVDIELTYGRRITDQKAMSDYTRASGRSFNTYMDQLLWPQTELVQHLKKRSAFINITLEDITRFTDRFDTIYSIDADPHAVPHRPIDPSSEGKKQPFPGRSPTHFPTPIMDLSLTCFAGQRRSISLNGTGTNESSTSRSIDTPSPDSNSADWKATLLHPSSDTSAPTRIQVHA